jgi:UDP-glucose 4-epimerase
VNKVLVTGGAGFIGSHVVEKLLKDGYEVNVLDNLSSGNLDNLDLANPSLNFFQGDIRNQMAVLNSLEGCDSIVHLAAIVSVEESIRNPRNSKSVNIDGTFNVLLCGIEKGINKFLHASSAAVYGDTDSNAKISEVNEIKPISPYGLEKHIGEKFVSFYCKDNRVGFINMRFFNVFGPRQNPNSSYAGVYSIFSEAAMTGKNLTIQGNGEQSRDFIPVRKVAEYISMLIESSFNGVVNIGTGRETTIIELAKSINKKYGNKSKIIYAPPRTGDIKKSVANIERIKGVLGSSILD